MEKNKLTIVCFEGGDGVGKTTLAKAMTKILNAKNIKAEYYREPGGNKQSEKIRDLIFELGGEIDNVTQLLLFFAARNELINHTIKENKKDTIIILDRFIMSSMVYQNSIEKTIKLFNLIFPDFDIRLITLYLTVDEKIIKKRLSYKKDNSTDYNYYDSLNVLDKYEKIYQIQMSGMAQSAIPFRIDKIELTENLQENLQIIFNTLWDYGICNDEYMNWLADNILLEVDKMDKPSQLKPKFNKQELVETRCCLLEDLYNNVKTNKKAKIPAKYGSIPYVYEHEYK